MTAKSLFFTCFILLLISLHGSNPLFKSEHITLNTDIKQYKLSSSHLISHSETIYADSLLLFPVTDYQIDYKAGIVYLTHSPEAQFLHIEYILTPELAIMPLFAYEKQNWSDSLQVSPKRFKMLIPEDSKLDISGSKTFALTFSDNETFDLKQSLFLNLRGELAPGVNITAQLSDSQSKLSPEGDSQELSSLDQVYIKIFGQHFELAMGDLEWEFSGTNYINYKTKFEGINLWYKDRHAVQTAYSANNGKRASMKIIIIEGKQGPYYLTAGSFQQNFLIVAGSERIYIDGTAAERGTDYSIDYTEGSISFKRLVTPNNDVSAYFQYSDEYYKQNMFFNSSSLTITDKLSLSHHFIYQADDKDNPLLYNFSPADLDSLRQAGDTDVLGNGVFTVGTGSYILLQTSDGVPYYEYADADSTAIYNVIFSYVGYQIGSYEEFATGKYRYVGMGYGSWIPGKRLVAPVTRLNLDSRLDFNSDTFQSGAEALYSTQDKNTLSSLNDDDNTGVLLYTFAKYSPTWDRFNPQISLDNEYRTDHVYFFADIDRPTADYAFNTLANADSLQQNQTNLTLRCEFPKIWTPELLLRYKTIPGLYDQRAVRFNSRSSAWYLFPQLNIQSTVSLQTSPDSTGLSSLLMYHNIISSWKYHSLLAKLDALHNSIEYEDSFSTRYQRLSPSLQLGDAKHTFTGLYYSTDQNAVKITEWQKQSTSQTYSVKNSLTTEDNSLIFDASHREAKSYQSVDTPQTRYDLVNLRTSTNFIKNAVSILSNYQLNQTEFFPKIRELQYIGSGVGVYDSTGVYVSNGDYDYVYITSETGTLSAEINGQLNLYLKPGQILLQPFWQKIQTDLMVQATELSADRNNYRKYFFYPGSVFNSASTLYGKQAFQQNLWLDIYKNRITGNIQYDVNRSLDKRYQDISRTYLSQSAVELQFRNLKQPNYRLRYQNSYETDSRYQSEITTNAISLQILRNFSTQTSLQLDCDNSFENGRQANSLEQYRLISYSFKPSLRSVWMQKYRLSSSITLQYNDRKGNNYLTFLPDKRAGLISLWNLSAIYRLNSFSSASLEYSGKSYPNDRTTHQLKMEFKAEL